MTVYSEGGKRCQRYSVCPSGSLFLLALCPSRRIYTDYSNGFPCPLALVGLSSGEQEIREGKERAVRVYFSGFLPVG